MRREQEKKRREEEPDLADIVGGKGKNLLLLSEMADEIGFVVPKFEILPVGADPSEEDLRALFDSMEKPLIVRSSSPWEDSRGLSFAGQFESVLGVTSFDSFLEAIEAVLASAEDSAAREYANRHGVKIDDRMAVIVQEQVKPAFSGVCYSTIGRDSKLIIEYTSDLANEMMTGERQGFLASFDDDFHRRIEYGEDCPGLDRVARVARKIEEAFGHRVDIEFAVDHRRRTNIVQVRPITDPDWPNIMIPELGEEKIILKADVVRGSGTFTGEVCVLKSRTELKKKMNGSRAGLYAELRAMRKELGTFNDQHPEGYCLLVDCLEEHKDIMSDEKLTNMRVLVTVGYASRFSHPLKVVSETGAFYLGALGRTDLLDTVSTGDTISVVSDQSEGFVYDWVKAEPDRPKMYLGEVRIISFDKALEIVGPVFDEIDGYLFVDKSGSVGVLMADYEDDSKYGMPIRVFYRLVDMRDGTVLGDGEYNMRDVEYPHCNLQSLLLSLFENARGRISK